jgi:intein-encoded DNA endonuclease-like protein
LQIELTDHNQQTIIKWFKNDKEILSNKKTKIVNEKHISTLFINNLQQFDSGKYVCAAKTPTGLVKSTCVLNVTGNI